MISYSSVKNLIKESKTLTYCSYSQLHLLVNICSNVLKKYNQEPDTLRLETIAGRHYVIGIDTDNLDTIVDMNFELADEVAANNELDSCKLIAVFKPCRGKNEKYFD